MWYRLVRIDGRWLNTGETLYTRTPPPDTADVRWAHYLTV